MRHRFVLAVLVGLFSALMVAGPTLACGGLIGPNGAVNLLRTTTLAAYHNGVEHYITAFQFAGGGGAFVARVRWHLVGRVCADYFYAAQVASEGKRSAGGQRLHFCRIF